MTKTKNARTKRAAAKEPENNQQQSLESGAPSSEQSSSPVETPPTAATAVGETTLTPVPPIAKTNSETVVKSFPRKPPRPRERRHLRVETGRAVLMRSVTLHTVEAKRVYKRTFEYAARNLYAIDVLTAKMLSSEKNEIMFKTVEDWLGEVRKDLQNEHERIITLYQQVDVQEHIHYTKPEVFTAEISTPLATRYLNLIVLLDEFLSKVHTLWLIDAIESSKSQVRTYQWQQRLIKLAGRFRALANGVRGEIKKSRSKDQATEHELKELLKDDDVDVTQEATTA